MFDEGGGGGGCGWEYGRVGESRAEGVGERGGWEKCGWVEG